MAEFVKVMEEHMRMCDTIPCERCPLREEAEKLSHSRIENHDCDDVIKYHPQKAEEIIMQWSRENPLPPPPVYPRVRDVINAIARMMGAPLNDFEDGYFVDQQITKEVAERFNIEPINKDKLINV